MFDVRLNLTRLEDDYLRGLMNGPVEKNKILFYGDSGFTRWQTRYQNPSLEEVLLGRDGKPAAVNHGFGTSTAEELLYYYPRLVRPFEPRALVVRTFGNDLHEGYSCEEIIALLARLFAYARTDFPGIRLYLVNKAPVRRYLTHPELARRLNDLVVFNRLAEEFCASHDITLLDQNMWPAFYEPGRVGEAEGLLKDIYADDEAHFNAKGYALYKEFFEAKLADIL